MCFVLPRMKALAHVVRRSSASACRPLQDSTPSMVSAVSKNLEKSWDDGDDAYKTKAEGERFQETDLCTEPFGAIDRAVKASCSIFAFTPASRYALGIFVAPFNRHSRRTPRFCVLVICSASHIIGYVATWASCRVENESAEWETSAVLHDIWSHRSSLSRMSICSMYCMCSTTEDLNWRVLRALNYWYVRMARGNVVAGTFS